MRPAIYLFLLLTCLAGAGPRSIAAQQQLGDEFVGEPGQAIRDAQFDKSGVTMGTRHYDEVLRENVIRSYDFDGSEWQERGDGLQFPQGRSAFSFSADGLFLTVAHSGLAGNSNNGINIRTLIWNGQDYITTNLIPYQESDLSIAEVYYHFDLLEPKIVLALRGTANSPNSVHTFFKEEVNGVNTWVSSAPRTLGNSSYFNGRKITLTADGNRMSFFSDTPSGGAFLEVYDWVDNAWDPVVGETPPVANMDDASISGDGQRLAISTSGGRVLVYGRTGQNWELLGDPVLNPFNGNYDVLGGLSYTGEYLWYGKVFNTAIPEAPQNAGCMQLFRFFENAWVPFGEVVCGDIESEYGAEITAISDSGLRTMIGANSNPNSQTPLGRVRIFDYSSAFPGNDKLADAFDLICGEVVAGTTTWAELDEAQIAACAEISPDQANVWYRYQGTDEWVTASLCGTDWDTRISVYYQDGADMVCVGSNDDYDCNEDGNWFGEESSQFRFFGEQGVGYFLMVQDKPGEGGDFQLALSCEAVACEIPFNQRCTASAAIPGEAALLEVGLDCEFTQGDNSCGSWATEFGPCVFPGFAFQDQWYRFNTDADPTVRLTLRSQGIQNSVINLYDDCGGEVQQCFIGEVDEELDGLNPFSSYFLQVLSLTDRTGPFDICVSNCNSPVTYYPDLDGDGYGDENSPVELCTTAPPADMTLQGGDCLDFHINAHEGMDEICDGWDNDCDGIVDNFCKDDVPGMLRVDGPESIGNCSGTLFAQSTGSGDWVYLLSPYGGAIAAFQDLEVMGSIEYSYRVAPDAGRFWELSDQNLEDEVVASRDITINVQFPPQQDIPIRLFYLKTEITAFQEAAKQAFLLEELPFIDNFSLSKVPAMGCPDGSLPISPKLTPISSWGESINGHYLEVKVESFSRFFLHVNKLVGALPVEFEEVILRKAGAVNALEWWVAAEEGVSHYQIERSSDGRNFTPIGRLTAANRSNYQFIDGQPLSAAYYRIKAIDLDGQFQYSKLLFLQRNEEVVEWSVYPNPAAGQATVMSSHAGELRIFDALGKVRIRRFLKVGPNPIDVSGLSAGVYYLRPTVGTRGNTPTNSSPGPNRYAANVYEKGAVRLIVKSH